MKKFALFCSSAMFLPATAFAQSTGSVDFEKETIVVTGTRVKEVGGVQAPDTAKAKAVLTQEMIARQNPGQTVLDTINLVPSVSFQNNDAYGSSGGTLTIRGFDSSRISLTFDGIQLNDSGNYAIYSNQQLDPELIEQVNVNLGSTDVDSPTASAVGGTVNYRTMVPTRDMNFRGAFSLGEYQFRRLFGVWNFGAVGPWGTRGFISASKADNRVPFNDYGKIDKKQFNGRLWQPIGSNGDFVSISGHYNENRNNFFGSLPLRVDTTQSFTNSAPRVPGSGTGNRYPTTRDERYYDILHPCAVDAPQAAVVDVANACGTEFDRRYNPSDTGNVRIASRFTLMDGVVLSIDPSFQFVSANGGGTVTANEGLRDINPAGGTASTTACATAPNTATNTCVAGYFAGAPFFGRDINGDGDVLDRVTVVAPSQTRTRRPGVIANLRWEINDQHTVRASYTFDRARHRQTGEVGLVRSNGEPMNVFPIEDAEADVTGTNLQKRDRLSYAILNQIAGEYRGEFGPLTVNAGLRAPFFERNLRNYCFTSSATGFVECSGQDPARDQQMAALNPYVLSPTTGLPVSGWSPPQRRVFKYSEVLPNVGAIYDFTSQISGFASYSKGLSVPGTDALYNSFFFPKDTPQAKPDPETTDSFDVGGRYRSGKVQAQISGWLTKYKNRLASAYDPELDRTVYRNLGKVDKYGIDGSVAYEPIPELTLYAFGSRMRSKIKDNLQLGGGTNFDCNDPTGDLTTQLRNCAFTEGKYEAGSPKYTYGFSGVGRLGNIAELGITAKRTGPRYIYDTNVPTFRGDLGITSPTAGRVVQEQIFGATAPAYWLVHVDGRLKLDRLGLPRTYLQGNIYNLFDKLYVGGFGGGLSQSQSTRTCNATTNPPCPTTTPNTVVPTYGNPGFVQIGAPRTFSLTLNFGF